MLTVPEIDSLFVLSASLAGLPLEGKDSDQYNSKGMSLPSTTQPRWHSESARSSPPTWKRKINRHIFVLLVLFGEVTFLIH